jgi:hypothetical protein
MKTKTKIVRLSFLLIIGTFLVFQPVEIGEGATDTDTVTLQLAVNQTIAIDCVGATPVDLGAITPGTAVYNSSTCTTTTNAAAGYDLKVKRDDADTTMDLIGTPATNITDKTAWDPTASSGSGNAVTWTGTGLAFGVYASTATKNNTWWGTGTTCDDVLNKYAGFPTAYATIMDHDSYSATSTTTSVCYKVDVPGTQPSGSYDGTVTYQTVSKP